MKSMNRSVRILQVVVLAVVSAFATSAARAQIYDVIYDFTNGPGSAPRALSLASDGNLYGPLLYGGSSGLGAIFRLNPKTNDLTVLHSFQNSGDGDSPMQALLDESGYLFGGTESQLNGCNLTTFRMDFIGNLTQINCGLAPPVGFGLTSAFGALFGVGPGGFDGGRGIFRMDLSGNTSIVYPLPDDGSSELLLASDGNLYGRTCCSGNDVLFRVDADGNYTVMHTFGENDGCGISGNLVEQGGFLWGTTYDCGAYDYGTFYRMDFAGNFATLHSFTGGPNDGAHPFGRNLLIASNSSFYLATGEGGQFDLGTLCLIDSFGTTTVLHSFGGPGDGWVPDSIVAVGNAIWGTTLVGPPDWSGAGVIFMYGPGSKPIFRGITPTAGPIRVRPGDPVQIHGGIFPVGEVPQVLIGGLPASNVQLLDQENISAATPPDLAPGTLNEIIIVLPDGTQTSLENAWMADFLDVPETDRLHGSVERVFRAGLMDGCGGGNFCEGGTTDRASMVTMSLKAKHGPAWAPPACTGVFKDVACPGPQADWVEDAVAEGIAQPCGRDKFCPGRALTRDDEAAILMQTEHGAPYAPPACTGIFSDVKCPGPQANAIEQAYNEGVVAACSTSPLRYCPTGRAQRGALAESVAKAFRLP